jgi:hypothetical protein
MTNAYQVIDHLKTESLLCRCSQHYLALACSVRYVTLGVCEFNQRQQRNGAGELILLITPNTTF